MFNSKTNHIGILLALSACFTMSASPTLAEADNANNSHTILPGVAMKVSLSNRDVNRIVCLRGQIDGYHYSEEKGALVSNAGSEAFIKFQFEEYGSRVSHVIARNEFYFICDGVTYTLVSQPSDIVAQTVFLAPGSGKNTETNRSRFSPMTEEERAVSISLDMLKEEIPSSFTVREYNLPFEHLTSPKVDVRVRRELVIEGTPYSAKEYLLRARTRVELNEKMFAKSVFGSTIFSITFDQLVLNAGEVGRLFIVYRRIE